jgi:Rieske Fe-S protein
LVKITLAGDRVITADYCVVATNAPIVSLEMQVKQAPYRTYAIAAEIAKGSVPMGLYWDTEDPYHYVRLQHGDAGADETDLLIIGGEDHKTGMDHDPAHRFEALYAWAKFRFPGLGAVKFQWSGQVMEPGDAVAFIGVAPGFKKVYVSTGDSGMGMTHGTIASMLIPDLIQGKNNPWESLYDPSRRTLGAMGTFVKENLTAVPQLLTRVGPGEVGSVDDIEPGSGAVIRDGLHKVAVHRTENGKLQKVSAVCTHLGCQVEWNNLEKTWDCPCHGSRFKTDGTVMSGPATDPLESV